jgi:hypothetical protein
MCVGSQGTLFQQTISSVLTTVALVEKINLPQSEIDTIRCKAVNAEYSSVHASGSMEGGTADVDVWWDPMDDGHELLLEAVHNHKFTGSGSILASARKKTWNVLFNQLFTGAGVSEPRKWTFIAVQKTFNASVATGEPLKASMNFEVERSTSLPTVAA